MINQTQAPFRNSVLRVKINYNDQSNSSTVPQLRSERVAFLSAKWGSEAEGVVFLKIIQRTEASQHSRDVEHRNVRTTQSQSNSKVKERRRIIQNLNISNKTRRPWIIVTSSRSSIFDTPPFPRHQNLGLGFSLPATLSDQLELLQEKPILSIHQCLSSLALQGYYCCCCAF